MNPEYPWAPFTDAGAGTTTAVHVTRKLPVRRDEVYRAWTEPELFQQWFTPPGSSPVTAEMDVRPGGKYKITLQPIDLARQTTHVVGAYVDVSPPERLVFTWTWEEAPALEGLDDLEELDSRVTVLFDDIDGATKISVTHERLDTEDLRAFHRWGWSTTLDQLALVVAGH